MPTYEYRCEKCGETLEVFQSFSEPPLEKHDKDGGKLTKVLSAAGVILKGSGFYKTDNRSGSKSSAKSNGDKASSTSSDSGSSSGSTSSSSSSSSSTKSESSSNSSSTTSTPASKSA
jgi:putative FmdB family regulatory protein